MQPEVASKIFNQKWNKPLTGYRIIKVDYTFGKSVNLKEDAQKRRTGDSIHFLWKELKKKDLTHQLQLFVSGNNKILKNY